MAFERLDRDVAFATADLVNLWLGTMQTTRDGRGIDQPHGFDDQKRLRTRSKLTLARWDEVIGRYR